MDLMDKAIENKKHISKNEVLNSQTWQEFKEKAKQTKVFLFGVGGVGADFFFEHCNDVELEGLIDNDVRKQGFCLADFYGGRPGETAGDQLKIYAKDILNEYDCDEVSVLITTNNCYDEIVDQLEKMGVKNHFVLLIMEANKRKQPDYTANETAALSREDYAELCCREKIDPNKIVFFSFGHYADHGKYITEALLRLRTDLDLVWLVNDLTIEVPKGVRKVYVGNWKRYIYELETARIWIYNMVVPEYVVKRQGQTYIQTKHWPSVTLKKFYLDSSTIQDVPENVFRWKYNSEIIDYIITGSDFDTQSSRRGFGFQKEVWQIGSPRSDALFCKDSCKEKVYHYYQIRSDIHTLVYAPTYRYDQSKEGHLHESRDIDLDYNGLKAALEKRFGGEWYIVLRLHPSIAKESNKIKKPEFVIDASGYEDSQELASACDIMISDYSSMMFEPAFVRKPVFLFATDKKDYIDQEYDLLIDYDLLPFPIAESNEELMHEIEEFQQDAYEKKLDAFMEKYGVHEDGHASERAAQLISELMDNHES